MQLTLHLRSALCNTNSIIKHNDLNAVFYCRVFRRTRPLPSGRFLAPARLFYCSSDSDAHMVHDELR